MTKKTLQYDDFPIIFLSLHVFYIGSSRTRITGMIFRIIQIVRKN